MNRCLKLTTAITAMVLVSQVAWAGPEWVEQGDAGRLVDGAQSTTGSGSVSKIRGTLTGEIAANAGPSQSDYHDMYVIFISDPQNFTATTTVEPDGPTQFDSRLFLFRLDGNGLLGNDDTVIITSVVNMGGGVVDGSFLTNSATDGSGIVVTEPGLYVLAITNFAEYPTSGEFNNRIFEFDSNTEISGPDGPGGGSPISNWENNLDKFVGGLSGNYEIILNGVELIPGGIEASMDIKPGGCPNSFNRTSNGVLPVSLLGSSSFDVGDVVLSSIRIKRGDGVGGDLAPHEGPPGPHSTYGDTGTPYAGPAGGCHELDGDGITDLNMKFKSNNLVTALQLNDQLPGAFVELNIVGELEDGTDFVARDYIRLVPPGTPPGVMAVTATVGGTWVDSWPPDLTLDTGGFPSFQRDYPQTTVVTLSSPQAATGYVFRGWRVNGSTTLVNSPVLNVPITATTQNVEVVFESDPWSRRP